MKAIGYATQGSAAGCHATVLGVLRLNLPGHPATAVALVPVGNNKTFDVYIYHNGDQEKRAGHGLALADAISLALNLGEEC